MIRDWKSDQTISENVVYSESIPPAQSSLEAFPENLHEKLVLALNNDHIHRLYSHQVSALNLIQAGHHAAITTSTASGKSLCYYLPILDCFFRDMDTCALFLFPTKALAQDQEKSLRNLLIKSGEGKGVEKWIGLYDGDTPADKRKTVKNGRLALFSQIPTCS